MKYAVVTQSESGMYSMGIYEVVKVSSDYEYTDYIRGVVCKTMAECQHIAITEGIEKNQFLLN